MTLRKGFLMFAFGALVSVLNAQTVLLEYDSSTGMLPEDFGWFHEGRSLERTCPGSIDETCRFYGNLDESPLNGLADNDGTALPVGGYTTSRGGNVDNTFPSFGTDNNAPATLFGGYDVCYAPEPQGVSGTETYGEWIEFDDGGLNLEHVDTVSTAPRTPRGATDEVLGTCGVGGVCMSGRSGAPCATDAECNTPFTSAPFDHDVLRLVGGDGNGIALSLPANTSNLRNEGKIKIKADYPANYVGGPITVVFKGAFGVKGTPDDTRVLFEYDVMTADGLNHTAFEFSHLWDNGAFSCNPMLSPDQAGACGKFVANNDGPIEVMGDVYTDVYKFVELRIACDADVARGANPDQACTVWVTDCETETILQSNLPAGYVPTNNSGASNDFRWGLISTADISLWVDRLQVLEGIVPPPEDFECPLYCADPVFDVVNSQGGAGSDGVVDGLDFNAFKACATGPTPEPNLFDDTSVDYLGNQCFCMDVNEDLAIDQSDFAIFQQCLGRTGAELLACDD